MQLLFLRKPDGSRGRAPDRDAESGVNHEVGDCQLAPAARRARPRPLKWTAQFPREWNLAGEEAILAGEEAIRAAATSEMDCPVSARMASSPARFAMRRRITSQ